MTPVVLLDFHDCKHMVHYPGMSPANVCCVRVGLVWASAKQWLIGDTKQATSKGKSGPVEAKPTGLVATALFVFYFFC